MAMNKKEKSRWVFLGRGFEEEMEEFWGPFKEWGGGGVISSLFLQRFSAYSCVKYYTGIAFSLSCFPRLQIRFPKCPFMALFGSWWQHPSSSLGFPFSSHANAYHSEGENVVL